MVIGGKIRQSWKLLYEHGDIERIHQVTKSETKPQGISRVTISNAIKTGRCSEQTFESIQNFYKKKVKDLERFEKRNTIEVGDGN